MGKYTFNRVLFGLAQAPVYFQRQINEVLTDCNFAMGYLDDIIFFQQDRGRTPPAPRGDIQLPKEGMTQTEAAEV